MKHYKSVEFLSNYRMSSLPNKRRASSLKTFLRRFCTDSPFFASLSSVAVSYLSRNTRLAAGERKTLRLLRATVRNETRKAVVSGLFVVASQNRSVKGLRG